MKQHYPYTVERYKRRRMSLAEGLFAVAVIVAFALTIAYAFAT